MPFGLTNALAAFVYLMDRIFQLFLDHCIIVFVDDMLLYARGNKVHKEHLRNLLRILRGKALYAKSIKCEFLLNEVVFLGHVISTKGISVDPKKVEVVVKWKISMAKIELRCVLGMAGYYKGLKERFFRIATPLTKLIQGNVTFELGEDFERSFQEL